MIINEYLKLIFCIVICFTVPKAVYNLAPANIKTTSIIISWRKDPTCPTCAYDSFLATYIPDSPTSPSRINALPTENHYTTRFTGLMPGKEYTFVVTSERNGKYSSNVTLVQRTSKCVFVRHNIYVKEYKYVVASERKVKLSSNVTLV